jgi:hypothetical protein
VDLILQWYGASTLDAWLDRIRRFWAGEGRCLVSVMTTQHPYAKQFDEAAAVPAIVRHLEAQASLPGLNPPSVAADWGTISTARYWGGEVQRTPEFIHIHPAAATLDEALALVPCAVDDPDMDARRAIARLDAVCAALGSDHVWLRTPDFQGPLGTAGLVLHQEALLMATLLEPDKLHAFLSRVTDFLIAYVRYLSAASGGRICGNIWPYTFLPIDLGVAFSEDMMPLMSADAYATFGLPTLARLADAFGGLHIHCCGKWGHHAQTLAASGLPIRAVEFHYPYTRIEELAPLAGKAVFVPYIALDQQSEFATEADYYRYLLAETGPEYRYWFVCAHDGPWLLDFAEGLRATWAVT